MTSVVMRALDVSTLSPEYEYQTNAALKDADQAPSLDDSGSVPAGQPAVVAAGSPVPAAAAVQPPGGTPLVELAEAQKQQPTAPASSTGACIEVGVSPRSGSPIMDLLYSEGWRPLRTVPGAPTQTSAPAVVASIPHEDPLPLSKLLAMSASAAPESISDAQAEPAPAAGASNRTAAPVSKRARKQAKGTGRQGKTR